MLTVGLSVRSEKTKTTTGREIFVNLYEIEYFNFSLNF